MRDFNGTIETSYARQSVGGAPTPKALGRTLTVMFFVLLQTVFPVSSPAHAVETKQLELSIYRGGDKIGTERLKIFLDGGTTSVETTIGLKVTVLGITAYSFTYSSSETWTDGVLQRFASTTDDDGNAHVVSLSRNGDRLIGRCEDKPLNLDGNAVPDTLWSPSLFRAQALFSSTEGKILRTQSEDLGEEMVLVRGVRVRVHHYRLTGEVRQDAWYQDDGMLAKYVYTRPDGGEISYVID